MVIIALALALGCMTLQQSADNTSVTSKTWEELLQELWELLVQFRVEKQLVWPARA